MNVTKALLACGVIAGPIYTIVVLIQAYTRPGFELARHSVSLLSNGELGWIQIGNFFVTGLLTIAGAVGMWQGMQAGRGRAWGPLLVGVYGLGLIGAGIFVADPAFGFPPGTPSGPPTIISLQGMLHFVIGGLGFLALITACFVFARRFASYRQRGLALYSVITGVLFFLAFFGIATGSSQAWIITGFWIGVIIAWIWISIMAGRLFLRLSKGNDHSLRDGDLSPLEKQPR